MEKTIPGFFYKMNISRFLLFYLFVAFSVLNIKNVRNEELVEVQSWAGFQGLNVLSVGAVTNDCKKIFDSCRADSQKIIDDLNKVVESTQDAVVVPPKLWDALGRITDILQNAPKNVRFHFAELGDHFMKKLNSAISVAKSKNFSKLKDLQSIYDSGVDQTNESVLELEKSFSVNYNPNSILQQAIPESLNQASYSQSVAMYELKNLSIAVTEEIDNIEKAALKLLNRLYRGITLSKELSFSIKKSGTFPTKYNEPYILDNLLNCSFLAKALKPDASNNNPVSQPVSATPLDSDSDVDPVIPSLSDETPGGDESGCGEIFRKSEKKIMQQLIITIKEIRPIDDRKEIDSRMFKVFKNYSLVLSNLNKKVITNVITVVNQFFQLYNIVLSILDKINPDMKSKAEDLLYLQDIDATDTNYENINKYIVEDYLSSSKMNELLQRIDNCVKSMKSLSEVKKGIIQELSVITNDIGIDLQTMKSTIIYVMEEIKKGVKALQNLKNKSNRTGFRYYLNFYRGKADLALLRKLICIINSLKIELLLERQLFTDDEELEAFKVATCDVQNEIDQKTQKILEQLNAMDDFNFAQGFVSKSVLDYNMCLETYTVQSRTILKKVITRYVTIFEELIIIIKRRKIKNAKTIEDLYSNDSSSCNQDEIVSKYLLEKTDINIEKMCPTVNEEAKIQNKESLTRGINELTTVTHSEVTQINETVLKYINTMSSEIRNLKMIRDEASKTVNYEISDEKLKCISNIIHMIDSLHIKSNKDEIQSLSIYFERVKEKIQIATQNFETQTSNCVELQQFKTEVETLKTSIFEALTKASFEINHRIRRVIFEYNEKMYMLQQNSFYCELNNLQNQESSFTLNDNTRKYVSGYYNSDEIFTSLDTIMDSASNSDISQIKTDMYAKLDETNGSIESELEKIHDDLNKFVEKFSQGMQIVTNLELRSQKQTNQSETLDQTDFAILKEVDGMVKIIGKYVNVNAENSQRELKVQIDSARLQISNKFDQVSETLMSTQDYTQMDSIIMESINSCETTFNVLKNNIQLEVTRSVEEFLSSYQKTITTLHSQLSTSQTTIFQDLNKGDCKKEDDDYENFIQMMLQQDYQSSTILSNTFEYMKKYNFVDSQNMKEKCSQVFQSLSNKINMEIDSISHISKYVLENVQKANNVLIKLENCENKQSITLSLTDEELHEFRVARSVNEFWQYSFQGIVISSIGTVITNAKSEIDLEYRKMQTKLESSTDQNIVQTEIQSCIQNIQNIFGTTQSQVNKIVKQDVESSYTSIITNINEFQLSGSSTLNTALQSVINDRSESSTNQQQNLSTSVDFNSFFTSANIKKIYHEIKTKTTQNSSQILENFKQVIAEKFNKVEKTSAYVVENVQKGYSVMEEIKISLLLDSNYQLTQYQEEQLKKCMSVSRKVGNLKVDVKTAQTTINNSISSIKNQINEEFTKINESVSLTNEKSIQETISKGINKFEELFAQGKSTVKEQLALSSSSFYSLYTQTMINLENQNSNLVCKVMKDISCGTTSYQSSSDQYYMDTVSYFNSKSFKSCLSIRNWFRDIRSLSSMETFSSVNEKSTKELSSLNEKITSAFDKMESSSTYVLDSIQKSTNMLVQIEESVKQDATYQLTEEQITEFQKSVAIYQSIHTITTTSTVTTQDSIQNSITDVKSKISSAYSEIAQSIYSCIDDNSITEIKIKGVQKYEKIFSQVKESVKGELFQSLNSFYSSFSQISTDSHDDFYQISSTLQSIKSSSSTYESEEASYQETISYFNSESFKSCVTIQNWFNEISSSSSSTTSSNRKENTINEFNSIDEKITSSLDELKTSSTFILQTIESSTQIFKQIETSMIQGSNYQLNEEQTTQLQKCMNFHQRLQKTIITSSTVITEQTIQSDLTNTKEEINSAFTQISQSISSAADNNSVRQIETVGVDKYETIFSFSPQSIKEQLFRKSSDFHSMFTQLSTDMKQENLQTVVSSENVSQSESDQSFTNMLSCFNNEMFTSTSLIKSWYSEIKKTTLESDWSIFSGGLSGKIKTDFSTLNEKVTKSIDSIQESSTQVLDTIKKGFETIKEVEESIIQDSTYKMNEEQTIFLEKCMTVHQAIETAMTTTSITETTRAKNKMESDISNAKSLIAEEFEKATETIKSLTDESSINEAATKSISNMDQFFSQTREKVETVLSDFSNNFHNTFQKVSSLCEKQENNQIKQVLSEITNNENSYQSQNDQSFSSIISYFNDSSCKSSSTIQNWYNELKFTSSTSESSNISESTINKLSTLNKQVTKSIDTMQQTSSYVIGTIKTGSEILKQIEETIPKNSNYQLNQDQVTYLQKCITIFQTMQSVTTATTETSTRTSTTKQTITSDIQNVKSKITDEFNKATETIKSLTDEKCIDEAATKSVTSIDQFFSETKVKVHTALSDSSNNFYDTYQKVSSMCEKQENSEIKQILSDITDDRSSYQSQNDQSFSSIISYFNDSSYKSSLTIKNWYDEMKSTSSTNEFSSVNESIINKLSSLDERVTKSIDTMQQTSSTVLDTFEKGSEILKQIEESTIKKSSYQLSQHQVSYLQKCITIYQTIQTTTTTTTSTATSEVKQTITSDIKNVKSKITDELTKVSESLRTVTDENSIKQIVKNNVNNVDKCYSETKQKVYTGLIQASSEYFSNYQQISSDMDKQDVSILQDIVSGKCTYQPNSDETYAKMVSYFNSDEYKMDTSVQNWYNEIHSSSSTTTNPSITSECAINELSTLNNHVTKSIDSMEEYSNYVLNSIDKGSEVIKQIQQSINENTSYHLTQTQIADLQKTINIYQIIQSTAISSESTTSTTISNAQQTITSEVGNAKTQINQECTKLAETIESLSDETNIQKALDDNVCKVEQYYGKVKNEVQTQLDKTACDFFNKLQSFSTTSNTQDKFETITAIQDILEDESTYEAENDESFNNVVIYLNSDSFKSNQVVQNLYQNIQSDTSASTSTNYSEQAINYLNTFNSHVSESVDFMEENSKYILNTIKQGSEVIQQIQENTKQDSNYKITQDQIIILKKCITMYQTIKTVVSTTTTSTTTFFSNNEKSNKTDGNNVNETRDVSQDSAASSVEKSIANVFGMGSENEKIDDLKKEDTAVVKEVNESADCETNHAPKNVEQKLADDIRVKKDVDSCSSTSISNVQQEISANVSNVKTKINEEFTKTSQTLNSMSDNTSIKKVVDENVQKVDNYYVEAKKDVQTHLTQTTSNFFNSCQKISENLKTRNSQSDSILQEIFNDKTAYQGDDDENFKQVVTYVNSNLFKSSSNVQNWYTEIHSNTSSSDLSKQSVDELNSLNGRVTESVDEMENHCKYILDTMRQGSEILKQIEDSSEKNTNLELTQNEIIVLKKCFTIYQIIETVTTMTTTVTNTVAVKNNSLIDHSVTSDDEYEYDIQVKKNTKEVVQVEEMIQKDKENSNSNIDDDATFNSISNNSVETEASSNEGKSLDTQVDSTNSSAATASSSVQSTESSTNGKDEVSSNFTADKNSVSENNSKNEVKKASHADKIERLKKFTQDQNTSSKTSLTTLMVKWTVTKSTTAGIPNTCESLTWDKYLIHDEDDSTIKEISDLLAVGRSVIEDSIELKKEKLPLYRDIDEIESMVGSCTEIVDEILLQLSEVVGQDVQLLKSSFSESLKTNLGPDASKILNDKEPTLNNDLLSAASTFFSMKDSKRTDLLNQINKKYPIAQINNDKEARDIATKKFNELQSIMSTVLDNIDCLVLRVVDTIENAKHSMTNLKNGDNSYVYIKNGQVLCDTVKIPPS